MAETSQLSSTLVGRIAPDFEIFCTCNFGELKCKFKLSDYRGRWLVLVFYPQDFSLICPTELTAFNNNYEKFVKANADILAISTDTMENHDRWVKTPIEHGGISALKFPLGSDVDFRVSKLYHVFGDTQKLALRGVFIIDPNSVIQYQSIHNLNVGRRIEEILRILNALQTGGLCAENWLPGDSVIDCAIELRPGMVIANYSIEEVIGKGGFATVYRAYDRLLERNVALKILHVSNEQQTSITNEAKLSAALNHPNVCTVFHVEESKGFPVIVMEYLPGKTLKERLTEGPLSPFNAAKIGSRIASGLDAAHNKKIVHGDLKPSNIILTDNHKVKIVDFGLSQRRQLNEEDSATLTQNGIKRGTLMGTPGYMSPEQTRGEFPTFESDVFSFGLLITEMLIGKNVISGNNILNILNQIQKIEPQKVAQELPKEFRPMIIRMLQPDKHERRITMKEIKVGLKSIKS